MACHWRRRTDFERMLSDFSSGNLSRGATIRLFILECSSITRARGRKLYHFLKTEHSHERDSLLATLRDDRWKRMEKAEEAICDDAEPRISINRSRRARAASVSIIGNTLRWTFVLKAAREPVSFDYSPSRCPYAKVERARWRDRETERERGRNDPGKERERGLAWCSLVIINPQ